MGLIARLSAIESETWPNVEAAAEQRYWDALALAASSDDHRTGAVYLVGYVAEMLLKTACCRIIGVSPLVEIRPTAKQGMLTFGSHSSNVAWAGGNFHDIGRLADALVRARVAVNRPMDAIIAGEVLRRVAILATHWSEELRYRTTPATETELKEAYEQAEWLHDNREALWR